MTRRVSNHVLMIGDHEIGQNQKPFIVAEMSGNHNRSLDRAMAIVDAAAESGAHAIKLQTYTADTMTLDLSRGEFLISDEKSIWKGRSLYDLYREAHTPWEWHLPIFERARKKGLTVFSTPFDESAVDFLETLHVPCYKIASFENTDIRLIRKVAATGKPMIVSTGMTTAAELDETVRQAAKSGCRDIVLLKCTSSYPAAPDATNLATIPHMRDLFECEVGLSDHTLGIGVAVASVAFGASVIEKHFTLSRADGGVDAAFSLEPAEMRRLVRETEAAWRALGRIHYGPTAQELGSMQFRRSLYVVKNLRAGDRLSGDNIRAIRPGLGLPTKFWEAVLGRRVGQDISAGTPLVWDLLA